MRRAKHVRSAAVAIVALAALALGTAPASADTEPNNVISYAEGPVAGGAPITGVVSTSDDVDFYVFYANSQQQLHLTYDDLTVNDDSCLDVNLLATSGSEISFDYTTPPGINRYFVQVGWDDGYDCGEPPHTYRFELDPGTAVTTGPAMDLALTPTGEPNETYGQAIGPLGALINYVGSSDTSNDEDWFWFWVPGGTHQLSITTTGPAASCGSGISLYADPSDSSIDSASAGQSSFSAISQTVTGPAKMYLKASSTGYSCSLGSRWQFRIDTPDALTGADPFPPPVPEPAPVVTPRNTRVKYPSSITLRRSGARYSGRVSSSRSGCKGSRRVVLRRKGSGTRSFGSATTRSNGTFTIRRSSRLRGTVYVVVTGRSSTTALCQTAKSRRIRG
jgi:hypothetical protein